MSRAGFVGCLLGCLLGCLPPARIETRPEPALMPARADGRPAGECRALISSRGDRGPRVLELRWSASEITGREQHPGLLAGTAERLFALRAARVAFDPTELYADAGAGLVCEQDLVTARRLPEGVAQPLLDGTPACVGEYQGERVEVETSLELLSAIGPLLGVRTRAVGRDPEPIGRLDLRTIDLRSSEPASAEQWLLEPSATMIRPDPEHGPCTLRDAPTSLADARGFAIAWSLHEHVRLRVGYHCCDWSRDYGICELDDPLPRPDLQLSAWLPDADGLVHSPYGCGSIGLDGSVRNRDGDRIGEHEVAVDELFGVVFLPADHEFELDWLGG